jgi:hypothetical protein
MAFALRRKLGDIKRAAPNRERKRRTCTISAAAADTAQSTQPRDSFMLVGREPRR